MSWDKTIGGKEEKNGRRIGWLGLKRGKEDRLGRGKEVRVG